MIEKVYKMAEVTELLSISKQTVFRLMKNGELPAVKLGGSWRFKERDIQRLIDNGAEPLKTTKDTTGTLE